MIYLPIDQLAPGMVLARSLPSGNIAFSLLGTGQALTPALLRRMAELGVQGAYVDHPLSGDVEPGHLIEPQFKQRMLSDISKMCSEYLQSRTAAGRLYAKSSQMAVSLVEAVLSSDEVMMNVIDIKDYDTYTYRHSLSVGILSVLIGQRMNLCRQQLIELALSGLLHDVGKLDIPAEIVSKRGTLTTDEARLMMRHPAFAADRLGPAFPAVVRGAIATHHESYDGNGYLRGLQGDKIPLYGRILSVADVFDALTSNRPYRPAWNPDQALEYMLSCSGTKHDPDVLDAFLQTVSAYPTGSVVHLSNGYSALVVRNTPGCAMRPTVRVLDPAEHRGETLLLSEDPSLLSVTVEHTQRWEDLPSVTLAGSLNASPVSDISTGN